MDNNKRIEEFFRNRVNSFDTPSEDWDRPDASVFENAQGQFPVHPQKKKRNRKVFFILFFGMLLLSLMAYIFNLKKEVKELGKEVTTAQAELQKSQEQFSKTIEQFSKETKVLKTEKGILKTEIEILKELNKTNQKTIKTLIAKEIQTNKQITQLINEHQKELIADDQIVFQKQVIPVDEEVIELNPATILKRKESLNEIIQIKSINYFVVADKQPGLGKMMLPVLIKNKKTKQQKLEAGLYYAFLQSEIPVSYEFSDLETVEKKEIKKYTTQVAAPRLHLGYSIQPKLWLTTGFRKANYLLSQKIFSELIYDESGEYTNAEGSTVNDLTISTRSAFSEEENKISLKIPEDTDIASGDILKAYWSHIQKIESIQIPIGLEYFIGKQKLQWHLKGGVGWNRISFKDYFIDGVIQYEDKDFTIEKNEKTKSLEANTQYFSGYVGLGLNYRMTDKWSLRTSLIAERNFIKPEKDFAKDLNSNHIDQAIEVGLNYRW